MKLKTRKKNGENQENQKLVLPKDNRQTSSQTNQEKEGSIKNRGGSVATGPTDTKKIEKDTTDLSAAQMKQIT